MNDVQSLYPRGVYFNPKHEDLIFYLKKKIGKESVADVCIFDVKFYKFNPWELTEIYPTLARDEWYFYTSRERKYLNGSRPNRAAGDGYWKATVEVSVFQASTWRVVTGKVSDSYNNSTNQRVIIRKGSWRLNHDNNKLKI